MLGAPSAREEEQARLSGARNDFVASLPRRLEVLRVALTNLEEDPSDGKRQHGMLRRVHALGSAARVLGFATVAEVLVEAERAVRRATRPGQQALAFQDVARALDLLPSLVLGGPAAPRAAGDVDTRASERNYPLSVLVFGPPTLLDGLHGGDSERVDVEHAEEAASAVEIAHTVGPDVAVIDADRRGARELVEQLLSDPRIERMPLLVLGSFVTPEAATAFVTLGAERVLPKPVSPETLRRTVFELHELSSDRRTGREPIGELTVDALVDRIGEEIRKGLVESVEQGGQSTPVDFAEGADVLGAVWGTVARLRELITVKSKGAVRFQPFGPEGAIPLAPWMTDERRAGERALRHGRGAEDVALRQRRILVADDDPAVVWFMTSLFKAVGAEVLEAHDGERALERVFESSPDLVVSDVLMPGRDGFSLCHEIKRDVVARDIPVILLSWKEDLLQRVRELGADADGYLRKEAAASTVVERVREVLRPRARIEQRLRAGGESRGRLDGITPRFVLERVCATTPDATLTVRDAVYLYEVHVRDGQIRSATRTASDGSFERGERVLWGLLGVSAGRFAVQPDQAPCRADFHEPLETLLATPIARARAALAALAAEKLPRVTRVGIDLESVGRYLQCTPESARLLIEQLAGGRAPRDLLFEDEVSPRLLESVLSDLARRGAISGVEREDGTAFRASVRPPRSSQPRASAAVAPAAAAVAPSVAAERAEPAALDTSTGADALVWSNAPAVAPASDVTASPAEFSDSRVEPSGLAATSLEPMAAAVESQALDAPPSSRPPSEGPPGWSGDRGMGSSAADLPPVEPLTASRTLAEGEVAPTTQKGVGGAVEPPARDTSAGSSEPELSAESLSIFAALSEGAEAPPTLAAVEEPIVPASDDVDLSNPSMARTLGGLGPSPEVVERAQETIRQHDPSQSLTHTLPLGAVASRSGPRPALKLGEETPSPGMADVIAAAVAQEREGEPALATADEPPIESPAQQHASAVNPEPSPAPVVPEPPLNKTLPLESAAVRTPATVDAPEPASEDLLHKTLAEPTPPPAASRPKQSFASTNKGGALETTMLSEGVPPMAEEPAPPSPQKSRVARADRSGDSVPSEGSGALRTAGLALVAFAAAFGLVRYAIVPMLQPGEQPEPAPGPSAAPIAAAVPTAAVPNRVARSQDFPLPGETPVDAGQGLVELQAGPEDQLYFDGVLVGRGSRRVPARPGRHTVRVSRGTESSEFVVEVVAARMTRLTVSPAQVSERKP